MKQSNVGKMTEVSKWQINSDCFVTVFIDTSNVKKVIIREMRAILKDVFSMLLKACSLFTGNWLISLNGGYKGRVRFAEHISKSDAFTS